MAIYVPVKKCAIQRKHSHIMTINGQLKVTHRHTDTRTHTDTDTQTQIHTQIHTHTHAHRHTHKLLCMFVVR